MALKVLKSPQSAQGTKNKSKNSQKMQKISNKTQEEIVPKGISVSLKKSFKKDKVKKLSSKKALIKKSIVAKNKITDKSVKLTKEVPTEVLKVKNSIAKTADTIKPVVKAKQGKKTQKCIKKENETTEIKPKSEVPVKLTKKAKVEQNKSTIKTVKSEPVIETSKSVVIKKGKNKPVKAKSSEENSIKENVKLGKKFKKQVHTSIKPNKNNKYDNDSKDKNVIVVAKKEIKSVKRANEVNKEPKKMVNNKSNEKIKNIKSKKRKLSETEEEEEPEVSDPPPIKTDILNYVKALLKYIENIEKNKKNLFESEKPPMFLQVDSVKIPKVPLHQLRILLPHSIVKPTDDVALFVRDIKKGRRRSFDETIHHYEDLLKEHGCTAVKTIIPLNQVKTEYRQFEMRRKLFSSHDFFLVDGRISGHMSHMLGKLFRERRKLPTSIHMDKKDLKTEIETALQKTILEIHKNGDTSTVQIGTCSMSAEDLTDNIVAVIEKLNTDYPGGWENIRSLRIKTPLSIAIPIYLTLKSRNTVKTPSQKPKRPKAYKKVKGELSTFTDDVHVTVKPDGSLKIVRHSNESDDEQNIKEESDIKEVTEKDLKNIIVEKQEKKEDEDDSNEENEESD